MTSSAARQRGIFNAGYSHADDERLGRAQTAASSAPKGGTPLFQIPLQRVSRAKDGGTRAAGDRTVRLPRGVRASTERARPDGPDAHTPLARLYKTRGASTLLFRTGARPRVVRSTFFSTTDTCARRVATGHRGLPRGRTRLNTRASRPTTPHDDSCADSPGSARARRALSMGTRTWTASGSWRGWWP